MNSVRAKFRNAAAFFWQHPVLWLPVLGADLCKSVFAQADAVFRHAVIIWSMPQSVMGDYGGGTSLPVVPIVLGGFLERLANVFGLFCYLYAFAMVARSVPRVQQGERSGRFFLEALPKKLWQTLGWSALAWTALPLSFALGVWSHHYFVEALLLLALVLLVPALYLLAPVLLRYASANSETDLIRQDDRLADTCFLLFAVVGSSVPGYVFLQLTKQGSQLSQLANRALAWFLVTCCFSLLSSLPYVYAMIGLTVRELPLGLFVYGTLHPDRAPAEIREEAKQLVWRGEASVAGRLQDLGEYPALLSSAVGATVEGAVFSLPSSNEALLAAFDRYEGLRPSVA